MGLGFTVACAHCGYQQTLREGIGMHYWCLENVIDLVPRGDREEIEKILRDHLIPPDENTSFIEFDHRLYVCPDCGGFSDPLDVRITDPDSGKELYRSSHRCHKCRSPLKETGEKKLLKLPCPACKKKGLTNQGIICWD